VGGLHAGHPVAQGLVDGVLQSAAASGHRHDLGAQQPHAEDVEGLALHVDLTHVDDAIQAEQGAGGGGGHPVLAGTRLGDDPPLAHAPGQQALADDVVDLVGAGVGQVLPLEQDPHSQALGESMALRHRRGPAGVPAQQAVVLRPEGGVAPRRAEGGVELLAGRHQGLGEVAAAELTKAAPDRLGQIRIPHRSSTCQS
jgi:hypothetical protein